jgi:H+/Cl- antiporter ClcA
MGDHPEGTLKPALQPGSETAAGKTLPKFWQIIIIGVIAIVFTAAWLLTYVNLNAVIWENEFITANRWTIPALVIVFSLLVGLCGKYLRAPNVIHGGFTDSMKGEGKESDYTIFPGTLLTSFFSLFSGASIGPEGPLAFLVEEISAWVREKLKISRDAALGFDVAALASAYNGIIGSPIFTAVFATEFNVGKKDAITFLAWNLLAGVIGFLFFSMLGLKSFANFLTFPPITGLTGSYILSATLLGILGAIIALFMGLAMRAIGSGMERMFGDKVLHRALFAGIIIAVISYFIPELMFSGETVIHGIVESPAEFGIAMLLFMAILKALLLALSFKSGFLGGPIFPTIFICTMMGLALSLIFPGFPAGILVLCLIAAVVTLALGAPLTAILLVVVLGMTDPNMSALLVLSSVVALIFGMVLREMREKRTVYKPLSGN